MVRYCRIDIGRELADAHDEKAVVAADVDRASSRGLIDVDGRVIEFLVNRVQFIKKGAPLAKLRTDTLKIMLAASQAELDLRTQELQEMKAGSLPEEKLQAESQMKAAAASSVYQKSKYERTLALHKRGQAATKADLDQALAKA